MNPQLQRAFAGLIPAQLFAALPHLQLPALRQGARVAQGQHRDPRPGSAMEFREHRVYQPGDDPRRIDWRAAARRDELMTRVREGQSQRPLIAILDNHAGMDYTGRSGLGFGSSKTAVPKQSWLRRFFANPSAKPKERSGEANALSPALDNAAATEKWSLARGVAAIWAYQALRHENPASLMLAQVVDPHAGLPPPPLQNPSAPVYNDPNDATTLAAASSSSAGFAWPTRNALALLDQLERLSGSIPQGSSHLGPCLQALARELHEPTIVVVVSDWIDLSYPGCSAEDAQVQCFAALQELWTQGHTLVGYEILHRDEAEFEFADHLSQARFEDPRGLRNAVEADLSRVRSGYLEALNAHRYTLAQQAAAVSMHWRSIRSDGDWVSQLLQPAELAAIPPKNPAEHTSKTAASSPSSLEDRR